MYFTISCLSPLLCQIPWKNSLYPFYFLIFSLSFILQPTEICFLPQFFFQVCVLNSPKTQEWPNTVNSATAVVTFCSLVVTLSSYYNCCFLALDSILGPLLSTLKRFLGVHVDGFHGIHVASEMNYKIFIYVYVCFLREKVHRFIYIWLKAVYSLMVLTALKS